MIIEEFDYGVNLLQVILWQYNEAINLITLLTAKQNWYDKNQSQFWEDWYRDVFNLQTANLFGLTVWSIILNMPLFIQLNPDGPGKPIFGFNAMPTTSANLNFNNSVFSNNNNSSSIYLTMEQQRIVLQLRYYQLVANGSSYNTNSFLNTLFAPQGGAWVLDGLDMTMVTVFNFDIDQQLFFAIQMYDLIPRPAGVLMKYRINTNATWGFGEFFKNFERGSFEYDFITGEQ